MMFYDKLGLAIGGAAVLATAYVHYKMSKVSDKVGLSLDELAKRTPVEIADSLVDKAVQRAVDREVGASVTTASNMAVRRVSSEMESQIRQTVNASYANLEQSVAHEIADQVSRLDIGRLQEDVKRQAKAAILEKFNGSLDDVLSEFNQNLGNVKKIYESIAGSLSNKQKSGMTFTIGE